MPAARHRSRSPSSAEAVIAMIGTRRAGGSCARTARVAVEAVQPRHPAVHQHRGEAVRRRAAGRPPRRRRRRSRPRSRGAPAGRAATSWLTWLSSTTSTRTPSGGPRRGAGARGVRSRPAATTLDERVEQLGVPHRLAERGADARRARRPAAPAPWSEESSSSGARREARGRRRSGGRARARRCPGITRSSSATSNGAAARGAPRAARPAPPRPRPRRRARACQAPSCSLEQERGWSRCRRRPAPAGRQQACGADRGRRARRVARAKRGGERRTCCRAPTSLVQLDLAAERRDELARDGRARARCRRAGGWWTGRPG